MTVTLKLAKIIRCCCTIGCTVDATLLKSYDLITASFSDEFDYCEIGKRTHTLTPKTS